MKIILTIILSILFLCSACDPDPYYIDFPGNLSGKEEKEWHYDSTSIRGNMENLKATLPCVSDDRIIFRYDNSITYYNNQTEYMLLTTGYGCGDSVYFDILPWEILQDTILNFNNKEYAIIKLTDNEMILKTDIQGVPEGETELQTIGKYDYYYARIQEVPNRN